MAIWAWMMQVDRLLLGLVLTFGPIQWKKERWELEISKGGCMVMTPAVFEAILRHGYLAMKDTNIIVFDECHHARKNSVYNQIMALHYARVPESDRPLIFGMTASPLAVKNDIETSIRKLEINLHSKAITSLNTGDISQHTNRPTVVVATYKLQEYTNQPSKTADVVSALANIGANDIAILRRLFNNALSIQINFAPWLSDVFLWRCIAQLHAEDKDMTDSCLTKTKSSEIAPLEDDETVQDLFSGKFAATDNSFVSSIFIDLLNERRSKSIDSDSEEKGGTCLSIDQNPGVPTDEMKEFKICPSSIPIPPMLYTQMSGKFLRLVEILKPYSKDSNFCGIVFVEKRCVALVLAILLPRCPDLQFLRADCLIGRRGQYHQQDVLGEKKSTKRTMTQFRNGDLNLLVATQVAEEGLDIQPCNVVIRFDPVTSVISNIQSRGRARHKDSKYILMIKEDDHERMEQLKKLELQEQEMNTSLVKKMSLEEGSALDFCVHDIDLPPEGIFQVETGAKITVFNAITVVHQFCSLLPHDSFANLKPIFMTGPCLMPAAETKGHSLGWISSVELPVNAPESCRFVTGPACRFPVDARRFAALETVKQLYKAGCFDERLKPLRYSLGPTGEESERSDAVAAARGIKRVTKFSEMTTYDMYVPKCFKRKFPNPKLNPIHTKVNENFAEETVSYEGYVVLFRVDENGAQRVLDLGLILPFVIPSSAAGTHIIMINTKPTKVTVISSEVGIPVDEKQNFLLQMFSHTLFFNGLLRTSPPDTDENDFLMPVVPFVNGERVSLNINDTEFVSQNINWSMLASQENMKWSSFKEQSTASEPKIYNFSQLVGNFGEDLIVGDEKYYNRKYQLLSVLLGTTAGSFQMGKNTIVDFYESKLHVSVAIDPDQPVLQARQVARMHQSGIIQLPKHNEHVYLLPQFCFPYPLSNTMFSSAATFMPMLIQSLYHRLQTTEIQNTLNLNNITTPLMFQVAFTASGALDFDNYERLEFLGDSYLKLHLTVHLFAKNHTRDEGWLTQTRSALERNKNLLVSSIKFRLPNALRQVGVTRRNWCPPMRVHHPNHAVTVSSKTAADIVEAIIGACVVSSGIPGGGKAVSTFFAEHEVAEDVCSYRDHMPYSPLRTSLEEITSEYFSQEFLVQKLHNALGYQFRNTQLAVEALTHTSAVGMYGLVHCFQRLEFLGDAILGFTISQKIYELPQQLDPGKLTGLKDEIINNQFLAVASMRCGLHKLVIHGTAALAQAFAEFGVLVEAARENSASSKSADEKLFWQDLPVAPKTISDVLEALIGAVFVDSGCDFDVVHGLIHRVLIRPWWHLFVHSGNVAIDISNPIGSLYMLVENGFCDEIFMKCEQMEGRDQFYCEITKHGKKIVRSEGASKRLAKRAASAEAITVLTTIFKEGDSNCHCNVSDNKKTQVARDDDDDDDDADDDTLMAVDV
ncbi:hypothetical protein HDU82_003263 [Entophlyctis luteolus]|nr:hypothetical protein HDU82_003263 [Entophlyctis luteolus]